GPTHHWFAGEARTHDATTAACKHQHVFIGSATAEFRAPLWPLRSFGLGNVNHRQATRVPGLRAATDVPGDIQLVASRIDGRGIGSLQRAAVLLLVERMQESDDLFLIGYHVVLHDRRAIAITAAMSS